MHDFLNVLARVLLVGGLILGYLLVRRRRARSEERYPVPVGLAHWHDVGPQARALRRRALRWAAATMARRVVVLGGIVLAGVQLAAHSPGWRLAASDWARIAGVAAALGAAVALTRLRRSLSDPLYARPKDATDERNAGVGGATWLRFGIRTVFYLFFFPYLLGMALFFLILGIDVILTGPPALIPLGVGSAALWWLIIAWVASLLRAADRRGMRYLAQRAPGLQRDDPRPYFLYLRTFRDDAVEIRAGFANWRGLFDTLSSRLPFEEVIAWRFHHYGPVIAANDPRVPLPTLGAAKLSLRSEPPQAWKQDIWYYAANSRAVVVSAAPAELREGIRWELGHLAAMEPERSLILLIPPRARTSGWKAAVGRARRAARRVSPAPHPAAPPAAPGGWEAFCDCVRPWPRFDGARQLNPTGAAHLIVYVPGAGWSAWGAERRTEWTYALSIKQAMQHIEEHRTRAGSQAPAAAGAPHPDPSPPRAATPDRTMPGGNVPGGTTPGATAPPRAAAAAARPLPATIASAIWLMYAGMAISLVRAVVATAPLIQATNTFDRSFAEILSVFSAAVWFWTAQRCRRGNRLGRVMALVFYALGCASNLPQLFDRAGGLPYLVTLAFIAVGTAAVVLLWLPASNPHFTQPAQ